MWAGDTKTKCGARVNSKDSWAVPADSHPTGAKGRGKRAQCVNRVTLMEKLERK
jgi:hypothetical protein